MTAAHQWECGERAPSPALALAPALPLGFDHGQEQEQEQEQECGIYILNFGPKMLAVNSSSYRPKSTGVARKWGLLLGMQMGIGLRSHDWAVDFHQLYDKAIAGYRQGVRRPGELFDREETAFLSAIGCTPQEVFDFAEDLCRMDEPSFETTLLITSVRRDYFLYVQGGKPTGREISMDSLPAKEAQLGGYAWLPRIIVKARAKLLGEMPADLMYGCAGDRAFLRPLNLHPADLLREVWAAGDDDERILRFVRRWAGLAQATPERQLAGAET